MNNKLGDENNIYRQQVIYEREYSQCRNMIIQELRKESEILDYYRIDHCVQFIIATNTVDLSQHEREFLETQLINEAFDMQIVKIQNLLEEYLGKHIRSVDLHFNFDDHIKSIKRQYGGITLEKLSFELKQLAKRQVEKNEIKNQFLAINSFMVTLSKVIADIVDQIFIHHCYKEKYQDKIEEIIGIFDKKIILVFQERHRAIFDEVSNCLKQTEDTNKFLINEYLDIQNIDPNHTYDFDAYETQLNNYYEETLKQKYCIKQQEIFYLVYYEFVQRNHEYAIKKFKEQFIMEKSKIIDHHKSDFFQVMTKISHNIYSTPFPNNQEKGVFYLLIKNLRINNNQSQKDHNVLTDFIIYLSQLQLIDQHNSVIVSDILSVNNKRTFEKILNKYNVDQEIHNYLQFLQQLISNNNKYEQLQYYTHLLHLYTVVTNKQFRQGSHIKILSYHEFFQHLRRQVVENLKSSLQETSIPLFFNFLDYYLSNEDSISKNKFLNKEIASEMESQIKKIEGLEDKVNKCQYFMETNKKELEEDFKKTLLILKNDLNLQIPDGFYLIRLSPPEIKSNNVIIAVSGFTSQNENKQDKWDYLADQYPYTEVYALQYNSKTPYHLLLSAAQHLVPLCFPILRIASLALVPLRFFQKDFSFLQAMDEAIICGKFLAHLIFKGYFHAHSSISLVGFSLGTLVIQEFLRAYKKLLKEHPNASSMIDSVVLLGGVANSEVIIDDNLIDIISNKLFNCHSSSDYIVGYLYKVFHPLHKPVGVNQIIYKNEQQQNKIVNMDLTKKNLGHLDYMDIYIEILSQLDLKQEYIQKQLLKSYIR